MIFQEEYRRQSEGGFHQIASLIEMYVGIETLFLTSSARMSRSCFCTRQNHKRSI